MKIRLFVSWCLIIVMLCACTGKVSVENEVYSIYQKDGHWYLELHSSTSENDQSENTTGDPSANISIAIQYPKFNSIPEMRQKIKGGDIPEVQIAAMIENSNNNVLDGKNNVLEICDLDNLKDLSLPEGLTYEYILWLGDSYSFEIRQTDLLGYIVYCDREEFNQAFEREYVSFLNENCSVITDNPISDRNAREVRYVTHAAELKNLLYNFTTEHSSVYVLENYVIRYFHDAAQVNESPETIPQSVRIFGNDGENYFYGLFLGFEERPSIEWLESFRLVPCTTDIGF